MSACIELTLQQLTQIALGGPELRSINVVVLQSLLEILLRKLDFKNEVVSIGGYKSKCLEKLLLTARESPLPLQDANLTKFSKNLSRLEKLEKRLEGINTRIDAHFKDTRKCNPRHRFKYRSTFWEHYSGPCEDLCHPRSSSICEVIQNADFVNGLIKRIVDPLAERMRQYEARTEKLHKKLLRFEEEYKRILLIMDLVKFVILIIESLKKKIDHQKKVFYETMEEVQNMLQAKLDRIHLPALKKYIKNKFEEYQNNIKLLKVNFDCTQQDHKVLLDGAHCLSCGGSRLCQEAAKQEDDELEAPKKPKFPKPKKKTCGCICVFTDEMLRPQKLPPAKCAFKQAVELNLQPGTDGNLYRFS